MEISHSRQQRNAELAAGRSGRSFRGVKAGSEDSIQASFFEWLGLHETKFPILKMFFAIPNGSNKSKTQRHIMQITGLKPGVPDTCLPYPAQDGSGHLSLWIEFKSAKGVIRPEQKIWIINLREAGSRVEVCRSWTDAVNIVISYLNLPLEKL